MKELLKRKTQINKQLQAVCKEISKQISEKHLPAFRKKYDGTYWKSENGYGSGDTWTIYAYFEEVTSVYDTGGNGLTGYAKGYTMQKTSDGTIDFQTGREMYLHSYTTPCSKEEFYDAYNSLIADIGKLPG